MNGKLEKRGDYRKFYTQMVIIYYHIFEIVFVNSVIQFEQKG